MRNDLSEPLDRACGHWHVAIGLAVSDFRPSIMTKISCSGYRFPPRACKVVGFVEFCG